MIDQRKADEEGPVERVDERARKEEESCEGLKREGDPSQCGKHSRVDVCVGDGRVVQGDQERPADGVLDVLPIRDVEVLVVMCRLERVVAGQSAEPVGSAVKDIFS